MRRILIVQPVIPHYRVPLLNLLRERADFELLVAASDSYLQFQSSPDVSRISAPVVPLAGGRFFWQRVNLSQLRKGDGVVFSGSIRFLNLVPNLVEARLRGLRIGWWGHWQSSGHEKAFGKVRRWLAKRADIVISYSPADRESAIRDGVAAEKVFVAVNTIDDRQIRALHGSSPNAGPAPAEEELPDRYFVFCGRLVAAKRVDLCIRALAALGERAASPALLVVGKGPEMQALRGLVGQMKLECRVRFRGEITDDAALLPIFKGSMALISPGPIGLAAPHALSFHTPVIFAKVSNGPEAHFLHHGFNALQVEQTAAGIARAMEELCVDPELRARLRAGAAASAERDVPIENMVDGYLAACRSLLGNVPRVPG
jgi:glycosyltransferase involved in cell wall biosynthesis